MSHSGRMIDFAAKDLQLAETVGVTSHEILGALGAGLSDAFSSAQARFEGLTAPGGTDARDRLDRDRLDSMFLELYATNGLLPRAGALVTVSDRLRRIAALVGGQQGDPEVAARILREAQLVRAFVQARVDATPALSSAVDQLVDSVKRLADFTTQVSALDQQSGIFKQMHRLRTAAAVADDVPLPKTLGDAVSMLLGHLSDSRLARSTGPQYDALCRAHAQAIREDLWTVAEHGYKARSTPATWKELCDLDLVLESLRQKLADDRIGGAERCVALCELYGLVGAARAEGARQQVIGLLMPLADVIRAGILQEAGR